MDYESLPPRSDELKEATEHIAYEFVMMKWTLGWLIERFNFANATALEQKAVEARRQGNAYLESCVVHCRNLVDFFACKRWKDDVIASDFLASWSANSETLKMLESAMEPHNKRLFHITAYRSRVEKGTHERTLQEIHDAVCSIWSDWFEQLNDEQRGWFNSVLL